MPKLIDFECPECGSVKEGFEYDYITCDKCRYVVPDFVYTYTMKGIRMFPIFSPNRNAQRWKHND